jgi:hypothetical protein
VAAVQTHQADHSVVVVLISIESKLDLKNVVNVTSGVGGFEI